MSLHVCVPAEVDLGQQLLPLPALLLLLHLQLQIVRHVFVKKVINVNITWHDKPATQQEK